jgi:hypothetical protein
MAMLVLTGGAETDVGMESHGEPHGSGHAAAHGERRRGLRVRQHRPVKIFEPAGNRYFGGQTEDISSTGLRIELPAFATVREGETLCVHVGLSRKGQSLANRRQMIPARVVWVNRGTDRTGPHRPGTLEAGVEFLSSIAALLDAA